MSAKPKRSALQATIDSLRYELAVYQSMVGRVEQDMIEANMNCAQENLRLIARHDEHALLIVRLEQEGDALVRLLMKVMSRGVTPDDVAEFNKATTIRAQRRAG